MPTEITETFRRLEENGPSSLAAGSQQSGKPQLWDAGEKSQQSIKSYGLLEVLQTWCWVQEYADS